MSLPPGFLDELKTRLSLSQVVGRKVMWDTRKSNQAKGDMWAPCPFHQEKTASFHVDDRKGYYYCFGCQAKGDVFGFVKDTENVGFMEAVEILAREAGMQMPAQDPRAREKADRLTQLAEVTEAAVQHFRLQLKTNAAAEARNYLERRGLSPQMQEQFEIGFAPAGQQTALMALSDKGHAADLVLEAGIATKPDDGRTPYDAFRDRIMFPIRDARGRCIGFGGRAMDPNARAKYLNSRETPLFDKGRALYNHAPARQAAGKGQNLIVAEGYMDVIALVQAGFEAAVAPLGTAITSDQLSLLWRITDEPIVALDGDKAGLRAAMRLVDLALPLIGSGRTLRFCFLPEGLDPDDLIKNKGRDAMQAALDAAEPLVKVLWRRETEGTVFDTPERRAALDKRLREAVSKIPDPSLKRHYGEAIAEMRRALFRSMAPVEPGRGEWSGGGTKGWSGAGRGGRNGRGFAEAATPLARTRALAGGLDADRLRCGFILGMLCRHPSLIERFDDHLAALNPQDHAQAILAGHLLGATAQTPQALRDALAATGLLETLERLEQTGHLRITAALSEGWNEERAATCIQEEFNKHRAARRIDAQLREALQDLGDAHDGPDDVLAYRLNDAVRGKHAAQRSPDTGASEQFGDTESARAAFHELLNTAGKDKKSP